jgi:3-deoxy-manno-octulosonate cytidylyltransferase (CMP-KDO synthetase)
MAAARLPNKPLLEIRGKSLLRRVYENCSRILGGDVVVAAGDQVLKEECDKFGAPVVLTDPRLPSGTDRVAAALLQIDPQGDRYDVVVNFQGDNVNVNPAVVKPLVSMAQKGIWDVVTGSMYLAPGEEINPNFVKICMGLKPGEEETRALYFTRAVAPYIQEPERLSIDKNYYLHVGIYVFRASSLLRAVRLPVGILEEREKLEQLRWLEGGMTIGVRMMKDIRMCSQVPADVNTSEELEAIRKCAFFV